MNGRKMTRKEEEKNRKAGCIEGGRLDSRKEAKVGRKENNMEGGGEGCTEGRGEGCRSRSFLLSQWTEEQPETKESLLNDV
jgi:hypothetical protein